MVRSLFRDWKKSWISLRGARLLPCIFLLLPWFSNATAAADGIRFDIPATTLQDALTRFTEQSGISVGMPGDLPAVITRPVSGELTAVDALQRLLQGSGLEPLPVGVSAYRLRRRPAVPIHDAPDMAADLPELAEVVVTGAKREQSLHTLPISMTVVDGAGLSLPGLPPGSRAAQLHEAAMSSTNLGPGRNRQYIRGVADSPFLGPSQATVSVQFDEARATYDGPDPDLRLLDVDRVEILKGPQGPLYGTGALGGVFRIVPRRPDLADFQVQVGTQFTDIAGGAAAGGGDFMINAPLVAERLGLRVVAYAVTEPGWIDNIPGRSNANDTRIRGGRVALRSLLPGEWLLDLQGVAQLATSRDSQYVTGTAWPSSRSSILPEPHDNDFLLGSLTAQGSMFGHHALVTASVISHEADGELDAGGAAAEWNVTTPVRYLDDRQYQLVNQELRLWSDAGARPGWLLGVSHLSAHSDTGGTLLPAGGGARNVLQRSQHVQETALFGELAVKLPARLRSTLGLRVFRSAIENERATAGDVAASGAVAYSATPSLSLDWRSPDERRFLYLRFARAVRPGGLNSAADAGGEPEDTGRFKADELSNLDLGMRLQHPGGALSLQAALFATRWSHIQSDYLLANGLVGTRNVGNGENVGVEASAGWAVDDHWQLEAGATAQHARLQAAEGEELDDARLPVVPDLRLIASVIRRFTVGEWSLALRADAIHAGATRLSFDPALDRKTSGYDVLDARISLRRAGLDLVLYASNLLDSHADTFAFGNPFSIRSNSQHTPLQPRSVTLGVGYSW
jgi:outer membrane receptor protein involved in Fe transport